MESIKKQWVLYKIEWFSILKGFLLNLSKFKIINKILW